MKRAIHLAALVALCLLPLPCATLARLSLQEMASKSTSIVRAKVLGSYTALSGPVIYTHYKLQVSERLKGQAVTEFMVRGGISSGVQQVVPGAPRFMPGDEYVFFLWSGKDGTAQVIGLTQGLFAVTQNGEANASLTRKASHELMLDPRTGHPVKDQTLVMRMSDLRSQIAGPTAAGMGH